MLLTSTSVSRRIAAMARELLARASPIPMKTTFDTRRGRSRSASASPPGTSPRRSILAPATTCSTISAVDRLRVNPPCPVAQKGQFIPQPAWLEIHIVTRSG